MCEINSFISMDSLNNSACNISSVCFSLFQNIQCKDTASMSSGVLKCVSIAASGFHFSKLFNSKIQRSCPVLSGLYLPDYSNAHANSEDADLPAYLCGMHCINQLPTV